MVQLTPPAQIIYSIITFHPLKQIMMPSTSFQLDILNTHFIGPGTILESQPALIVFLHFLSFICLENVIKTTDSCWRSYMVYNVTSYRIWRDSFPS